MKKQTAERQKAIAEAKQRRHDAIKEELLGKSLKAKAQKHGHEDPWEAEAE